MYACLGEWSLKMPELLKPKTQRKNTLFDFSVWIAEEKYQDTCRFCAAMWKRRGGKQNTLDIGLSGCEKFFVGDCGHATPFKSSYQPWKHVASQTKADAVCTGSDAIFCWCSPSDFPAECWLASPEKSQERCQQFRKLDICPWGWWLNWNTKDLNVQLNENFGVWPSPCLSPTLLVDCPWVCHHSPKTRDSATSDRLTRIADSKWPRKPFLVFNCDDPEICLFVARDVSFLSLTNMFCFLLVSLVLVLSLAFTAWSRELLALKFTNLEQMAAPWQETTFFWSPFWPVLLDPYRWDPAVDTWTGVSQDPLGGLGNIVDWSSWDNLFSVSSLWRSLKYWSNQWSWPLCRCPLAPCHLASVYFSPLLQEENWNTNKLQIG